MLISVVVVYRFIGYLFSIYLLGKGVLGNTLVFVARCFCIVIVPYIDSLLTNCQVTLLTRTLVTVQFQLIYAFPPWAQLVCVLVVVLYVLVQCSVLQCVMLMLYVVSVLCHRY